MLIRGVRADQGQFVDIVSGNMGGKVDGSAITLLGYREVWRGEYLLRKDLSMSYMKVRYFFKWRVKGGPG